MTQLFIGIVFVLCDAGRGLHSKPGTQLNTPDISLSLTNVCSVTLSPALVPPVHET